MISGICVAAVLTISALLGGFYHFRQSVMDARLGKFDFQKKNAKSPDEKKAFFDVKPLMILDDICISIYIYKYNKID